MIRTFVDDVIRSFGPYLERGRCLVMTPDETSRQALQQAFQTAIGCRGILPEITKASEWACYLHGWPQQEAVTLFWRFLQSLREGVPKPSWPVALQQAWLLLKTTRFCRKEGGTTALPPLPLASLPPSGMNLWNVLQSVDAGCPQSDREEEEVIETFVRSHSEEAFVFFDGFPFRERPFLQAIRNVFRRHSNAQVWQPQAPAQRSTPLFVGEFRSCRAEASFIVEDIQRRLRHSPLETVAIITDDKGLRQHLLAESLRKGLPLRMVSAFVNWADTGASFNLVALAEWLQDGSLKTWAQWGDALMDLAELPEAQRRFWHFFSTKVVHSAGMSVGSMFTVPAFASPEALKAFVEKRTESFPEAKEWYRKFFAWRQERNWTGEKTLCGWVRQHLQACEDWAEMTGVTLSIQALSTLEDRLSPEDKGEPICAGDYVQILTELLRVMTKEAPRVVFPNASSSEPRVFSVQESALMAFDTVYLAGLNETWAQSEEPPPFFYKEGYSELKNLDLLFRYHLTQRTVTVTRTEETRSKPHALWHVLSELPASCRVDVSESPQEPRRNGEETAHSPVRAFVPWEARPRRFSATDWQLLQDDPYAYYAKAVLRLVPSSRRTSLSQNLGLWAHDLLHRYFSRQRSTTTLADFAEQHCAKEVSELSKIFWQRLKPVFLEMSEAWERDRQTLLDVQTEVCKERQLSVQGQAFSFFGVCDRVDRFADRIRVVDFKTGRMPKEKELRELSLWQMPLEASILDQENTSLPVEMTLVSLRSAWGKEREYTLLFDEELKASVEERLESCLEEYCHDNFVFETKAESPTRAVRYAALERVEKSSSPR